jgi:hypothetical protein
VTGLPGYEFPLYVWGEPYWHDPYSRTGIVNPMSRTAGLKQDRFDHTFTVPDGMWVLRWHERINPESKWWEWGVLGNPKPQLLNLGRETLGHRFSSTLLYSTTPFALIEPAWGDDSYLVGPHGFYLNRARQIHKGELGRYVEVELPLVARELREKGSNRSRKRGDGWVKLPEVVEMSGLTIEQVVLDHWMFVEARDRSGYVAEYKDVRIELILGDRDQIHKRIVPASLKLNPSKAEFEAMLADDTFDWSQIWIRRGFARTVLLLNRYGWNTSREQLLCSVS